MVAYFLPTKNIVGGIKKFRERDYELGSIKVEKKDGVTVPWDDSKILKAINLASSRAIATHITDDQCVEILAIIHKRLDFLLETENPIRTKTIHRLVMESLFEVNKDVYLQYKSYRDYKERFAKSFTTTKEFAEQVLYEGDKENANKDSSLNSTKQALISESTMKELMKNFELNPEWVRAHESGWIHIHDIGSRYLQQINCQLFDMGNLLKGGFELNGAKYKQPTTIQTAFAVIGDVTLSASAQQYGGFSISEIDTVLLPYAESTYNKHYNYYIDKGIGSDKAQELAEERTDQEIEKGCIGFETKLNTISNSLGQIPFVTVTFGLNTAKWAKKISSTLLSVRKAGMSENHMTAIFPKLVFLSRKEINRSSGSPNYDLYKQAIDCSKTRLYPDYLSLDGENNNLCEVYERSGKVVSPMG